MVGRLSVVMVVCTLTLAACSKSSRGPAAPTSGGDFRGEAAADGSTLKATAPAPQSPINNQQPADSPAVLTIANATAKFAGAVSFNYRFEVYDTATGTLVARSPLVPGGGTTTSWPVSVDLEGDRNYSWQARAEYQDAVGSFFTPRATFLAPRTDGYIRGAELYDPLINGKSIGQIVGPHTFLPGVGVRLDTPVTYIRYQLQQTLEDGEISVLVTNMPQNTEGEKTKVFAMAQGDGDLTTNERRFTVEKRGDPDGTIAWRVITDRDQIETIGNERRGVPFQASLVYLFRATYGFHFQFRLTIHEGGAGGREMYNFGKEYGGYYDPDPHVVFIGAPPNRSGATSQSIEFAVYRHLWVSNRPRPLYAHR